MKKTLITLMLMAVAAPAAWSQDRIYRCGNEYTNNAVQAKERGCKLVEGGNVTVVQGNRPAAATAPVVSGAAASSPSGAPRVNSSDQRARDSDARAILESELRKAEARQESAAQAGTVAGHRLPAFRIDEAPALREREIALGHGQQLDDNGRIDIWSNTHSKN